MKRKACTHNLIFLGMGSFHAAASRAGGPLPRVTVNLPGLALPPGRLSVTLPGPQDVGAIVPGLSTPIVLGIGMGAYAPPLYREVAPGHVPQAFWASAGTGALSPPPSGGSGRGKNPGDISESLAADRPPRPGHRLTPGDR